MSTKIAQYLSSTLCDHSCVSAEALLTALFYAEKSVGLGAVGAGDELKKLLEEEEFSHETSQRLKGDIVSFAESTDDVTLFQAAVGVLRAFNDPKLDPLLTSWLNRHLRNLLRESGAVSQLLCALEDSGALLPRRTSCGASSIELNVDAARAYLNATLGIAYPW